MMDWRGSSPGYTVQSSELFLSVEAIRLGLCEDLSLFGALVSVSENVCFLCESIIKLIFHPWIFSCLILSYFSRRPSPEHDCVDVESVLRACAWMGEMCCYGYGSGAWVSGAGGDIKDDCDHSRLCEVDEVRGRRQSGMEKFLLGFCSRKERLWAHRLLSATCSTWSSMGTKATGD